MNVQNFMRIVTLYLIIRDAKLLLGSALAAAAAFVMLGGTALGAGLSAGAAASR